MAKITAVIDIGSNSARMMIYEKTSRFAFHMINETKSKVRISEDAYKNGGTLQKIPMQRAFEALCDFVTIAKSYKVRKILCVATSALRDAPNKMEFIKKVKKELGINIKIISGEKEALFGGVAAANLLPLQSSSVTVDIGGGSTELAKIEKKEVVEPISLNLGTVRLKELFFDHDNLKGAIDAIENELQKLPYHEIETLIGIGGTFRAIIQAIMKKEEYPLKKIHAFEIAPKKFVHFLEKILDATSSKALKKLGIKEERFDVIKPGALILLHTIKKLKPKKIVASGVGVREGVYLSDLLRNANLQFPANFNPSIRYLIDSYIRDRRHSNLLAKVAKELFLLTYKELGLDMRYKKALFLAAKLYPIGSAIHFYSKNKHSYYIIQAALEYGFSHHDTMLIATLARYAKRKLPSKEHYEKYKKLLPPKKELDTLSVLLSISVALLTHRPCKLDFELSYHDKTLYIQPNEQNCMRVSKEAIRKLNYIEKLDVIFLDS